MWEAMFVHHSSQLKIAVALRNLDVSLAPKETSDQHHERTVQLYKVLQEWHSQFQNLMKFQKEYILAFNNWLKLNLIPIESNLKEKVSSPQRVTRPAIQPLLNAWQDLLEKIPDDRPRGAIHTFAEVVHTILIIQDDELKLKEKCEDTRREYIKRSRAFDDWSKKYKEKKAAAAAVAAAAAAAEDDNAAVENLENRETANQDDEIVAERKAVIHGLMIRLKEEEESYMRICKQVREKSIGSLKTHLPELFRAISEFALECSEMYKKLRSITTEPQDAVEAD